MAGIVVFILDLAHDADLKAVDSYRSALGEAVYIGVGYIIVVLRMEDIDSFKIVNAKENDEQRY